MQRLEVSYAVRPIYGSLGAKGVNTEVCTWMIGNFQTSKSLNIREREYSCLCPYVINTYAILMYELKKKLERCLRVNLLGPGPSSYKKRIYRAAVSQRLGNTGLHHVRARCCQVLQTLSSLVMNEQQQSSRWMLPRRAASHPSDCHSI
jgi:hypothetical protein